MDRHTATLEALRAVYKLLVDSRSAIDPFLIARTWSTLRRRAAADEILHDLLDAAEDAWLPHDFRTLAEARATLRAGRRLAA